MTMFEGHQLAVILISVSVVLTSMIFFLYVQFEPTIKCIWKKYISKIVHITH